MSPKLGAVRVALRSCGSSVDDEQDVGLHVDEILRAGEQRGGTIGCGGRGSNEADHGGRVSKPTEFSR